MYMFINKTSKDGLTKVKLLIKKKWNIKTTNGEIVKIKILVVSEFIVDFTVSYPLIKSATPYTEEFFQ